MTDLQVQFTAFTVIIAAITGFAGFRLAVTDGLTANAGWGWAGAAGAAAFFDLGVVYDALSLDRGAPDGDRIGAVALGVLCAVGVAVVAYSLNGGTGRGGRWCATASAFTVAMAVFAVVLRFVS